MIAGGDLHIDEEFRRAKRNLLWFCSLAVVLWMVHVPIAGVVEPPMLGSSVTLDVTWLRGIVWLACLYSFIGFYRQVRDVDRLNSQAIYTAEFGNIRQRLVRLDDTFGKLCERAESLLAELPSASFVSSDLATARSKLKNDIDQTFKETDKLAQMALGKAGPNADNARYRVVERFVAARNNLSKCIQQYFDFIENRAVSTGEELPRVAELAKKGLEVSTTISEIRDQFDRLHEHIRADHQLLYTWYDKYLSYTMFILASVASAWELPRLAFEKIVPAAKSTIEPINAWLVLSALAAVIWGVWWLARKILSAKKISPGSSTSPLS